MQTTINCHAKLNFSLLIYKARKDNYHPLRSIFQTIDLHDTLTITPMPEKILTINCTNNQVPTDEQNILFKVYNLVEKHLQNGFIIDIQKRIPMGGGLGGGSSNAAGFIKYLKEHYPLLETQLTNKKISLKIGADVPFFLQGKTALVSGIGEKITHIPIKIQTPLLLILPDIHCDTKTIYQTFDLAKEKKKKPGPTPKWMITKHIGHNDLKKIAFGLHPKLLAFELSLKKEGIQELYMSGSGSTLFIPLTHTKYEEKITTIIQTSYPNFRTYKAIPIATEAIQKC